MHQHMKALTALLLLMTLSVLFGADEVKLPADAQAALTAYDAKVAKLKADYDAAVAKESDALVAKLQKSQEAATKKGDLDTALALKTRIDALPQTDLLGNRTKPEPAKPVSTSKNVVLCSLPDFKGQTMIVKEYETIVNVHRIGFPNDGLRSVRLPAGWTMTVYANEDAGGASFEITSETADLTGTPANGMTSFVIHRGK